jgi:hypothetical protein
MLFQCVLSRSTAHEWLQRHWHPRVSADRANTSQCGLSAGISSRKLRETTRSRRTRLLISGVGKNVRLHSASFSCTMYTVNHEPTVFHADQKSRFHDPLVAGAPVVCCLDGPCGGFGTFGLPPAWLLSGPEPAGMPKKEQKCMSL